jgi:hypothetical protein
MAGGEVYVGCYWLVADWKRGEPSRGLWKGPKCTTVMQKPFTIEDEGTKFLQNIKNHSPTDTMSHHSRTESQCWDCL